MSPPIATSASADRFGTAAGGWFRATVFPLFLMVACPPLVAILWITAVPFEGSIQALLASDLQAIAEVWPWPTWAALRILLVWIGMQAALLVLLPSRIHDGPLTPRGNRPRYRLNGLSAFFVTHVALYYASVKLGWFSPTIVYDHFGELLMTSNLVALAWCAVLYCKGALSPSSSDHSRSDNLVWDYYWGVELHPRMFGMQLKQLINCRVAMMGWSIILLSFLAKQYEIHGHVSNTMAISVGLQIAYIIKFFHWEGGYFNTLDIMHDRFGFYICWGVMVWLPCVYTLVGLYLVDHPFDLPMSLAGGIALVGVGALWANYDADAQRRRVRATRGSTTVWGREPDTIEASYETLDGERHTNLLLVSGWWGLARHFHYVPELTLALMWTIPVGFEHALPYFYFVFLTILLVDRSGRDELRCRGKYGESWDEYCRRVPYRIVPGVY